MTMPPYPSDVYGRQRQITFRFPPYAVAVGCIAILYVAALVVLHSMGGRLHWAAEGMLAALVGLGISALGTALVLAR